MANRFKKMIQPLLDEARREGYKAGHEDGMNEGFRKKHWLMRTKSSF